MSTDKNSNSSNMNEDNFFRKIVKQFLSVFGININKDTSLITERKNDMNKQSIKKKITLIFFLIIGGILLIFPQGKDKSINNVEKNITALNTLNSLNNSNGKNNLYVSNESISNDNYRNIEEERIKEFVSTFPGVSDCSVLLRMESGKEKVLAKGIDEIKNVTSDGSKQYSIKEQTIYKSDNNPYVLKELEPSISGIVITLKGNVTQVTINEVKEAMKAYLNIPISKVKVYRMNKNLQD